MLRPLLFSLLVVLNLHADELHPLFQLENVYPEQDVELKVSAMTFMLGPITGSESKADVDIEFIEIGRASCRERV